MTFARTAFSEVGYRAWGCSGIVIKRVCAHLNRLEVKQWCMRVWHFGYISVWGGNAIVFPMNENRNMHYNLHAPWLGVYNSEPIGGRSRKRTPPSRQRVGRCQS